MKRINILNRIIVLFVAVCILCSCAACGNSSENNVTSDKPKNGEVSSPEEFKELGVYIDVNSPDISEKKYSIEDDEIAVVYFIHNGLECELRASCVYEKYELANVKNTNTGDIISTDILGWNATYYTLRPGRIVFWKDEHVNYSLYTQVTATDDVVKNIVKCVEFQDFYYERADVEKEVEAASRDFAQYIINVFQDKDINAVSEILYYPQQLGEGQSAANKEEFLMIPKDELFTDILLTALSDDAMDNFRMSDDETDYIIGTNYKNVHFRKMEDGSFKIVKINN